MTLEEKLISGCKQLGIEITEQQVSKFMEYMDILLEYNEKMNLTAITEKDDIIVKHFIDSLTPLSLEEINFNENSKVIDIGTGAGFPSIPLKIMLPATEFLLVDSLKKRIGFLDAVIEKLELTKITTIHGRCEELSRQKEYREKFDIALSRAVANMQVLGEYVVPFLKVNGKFLALKGPKVYKELESATDGLRKLGCNNISVKTIKLPYTEISHKIAIINKEFKTPFKYPRHSSKISSNPL